MLTSPSSSIGSVRRKWVNLLLGSTSSRTVIVVAWSVLFSSLRKHMMRMNGTTERTYNTTKSRFLLLLYNNFRVCLSSWAEKDVIDHQNVTDFLVITELSSHCCVLHMWVICEFPVSTKLKAHLPKATRFNGLSLPPPPTNTAQLSLRNSNFLISLFIFHRSKIDFYLRVITHIRGSLAGLS